MISVKYSISDCIKMLCILDKNKIAIMSLSKWPDYIVSEFGECEFFFTNRGTLVSRSVRDSLPFWRGPILLDDFWIQRISQSISFCLAKFGKSLQKRTSIENIAPILYKFHNFKPNSII